MRLPRKIFANILFIIPFLALAMTSHARETIVLNTYLVEPPLFNFIQELMKEVFNRVDMDVTLRSMPAERALQDANSDHGADGEALRTEYISRNYPNLIRVPEQIFTLEFVAFSISKDFSTDSWESLKPYHVAHIRGMKAIESSLALVEPRSVQSVENEQLLFTLLAKGRTDVVVWGHIEGLITMQKLSKESETMRPAIQKIRVLKPPFRTIPLYLFLNKRHKGLVSTVDLAIKEVKKSGAYQKIYDQVLDAVLSK